jgi:Skp family chaperone for outer membrane proteins
MNGKIFVAAAVCVFSSVFLATTFARGQDALPIAILNMDRVFKTHKPFLDQLAPVREEAKQLQEKLQLRQAEVETVANQIRKAEPNTPEFQRLQAQLLKLNGELRKMAESGQQSIQKQESTIYLAFYRIVDDEVAKYAKAKGLKLVLRQQDSSLDENQPLAELLKSLNRGIVYQDGLDITDDILKALDARAANKP